MFHYKKINNLALKSVLFLCFILISSSVSQVNQQWVKTYTFLASGINNATGMVADGNGNIFITGNSTGNTSGEDYCTVKYSSNGTQQWAARYSGFSDQFDSDYPLAITRDYPGNVYVTGRSRNANISYFDIATIKYSPSGEETWIRRYSSSGNFEDGGYAIHVDNSSNVYVTGHSNSHMIVIKYNSFGTELWKTIHPDQNGDKSFGHSIIVDGAGNIYTAGEISDNGNNNALLVKLSSAGVQLWERSYSTAVYDTYDKVTLDLQGNILVNGNTGVESAYDFLIEKYNSDGENIWSKKYNNPSNGNDLCSDIAVDYSHNVYVTGSSFSNGSYNYTTIKYSPAGSQLWLAIYNGDANLDDGARALTFDGQGNVYVTGNTEVPGNTSDMAIVKYNSGGFQQWAVKYDGAAHLNDFADAILLDNSGNIVISGETQLANGSLAFCTVKYTPVNGIQILGGELPQSYNLSQNYPNPFNPVTNINFSVPKSGNVKLAVYDIIGRETAVLVNENLNAGTYKFDFDASGLASGTYFYRITADDYSEVKKMILVK